MLQPGSRQVAAGYVVYGSSTVFVYSVGNGVHGFTLDPAIGAYVLSHENIRMPAQGTHVASLVGDATPVRVGEQPALRFRADGSGERDERCCVGRFGRTNLDVHSTTTPAPPRRGSPAAASVPSEQVSTAAAPPKNRFRRRHRTTS